MTSVSHRKDRSIIIKALKVIERTTEAVIFKTILRLIMIE